MNILYARKKYNERNGGSLCAQRNLMALQKNNKVFQYIINIDRLNKLKSILLFKPFGYSSQNLKEIKAIINKENINMVFIDNSQMGGFAKLLKSYNLKIIVFFHNVEQLYFKDKIKVDGLANYLMMFGAKQNELKAVKYADYIITLTERDSQSLQKLYGRKADLVSPMTMIDTYKTTTNESNLQNYHLFVGSSFFANKHGIEWYIENVLEHVDSKLVIIGKGMRYLLNKYFKRDITVIDYMVDLATYYNNADFVINPVFLGSGMKTKTIEALMFGKNIIGTNEAFVGMNTNNTKCTMLCNTAADFINTINDNTFNKYCNEARELFLSKYSVTKTIEDFEHLISNNTSLKGKN